MATQNYGAQFSQILQNDPQWAAYRRDPMGTAQSLGITDPMGYYKAHPQALTDLVGKRIIGAALQKAGSPIGATVVEGIHVNDGGHVSLGSDTGWLENAAPWIALAAAGAVGGAGALGAFGGGSGTAGGAGTAASSAAPSGGLGGVSAAELGAQAGGEVGTATTGAFVPGAVTAGAGGAASTLGSALTGGSGLASSILKLAAPALVAIAARPGGSSGNGPGGVPTGGPGGTPNYPPELQQLLAESMKRVASQGPLFDAATRQALAGLPTYAKGGG